MKTVTIEKMDHQGRGITHIDGKICFVSNALPEECCEIKIIKENKKMIEATAVDVIKKSSKRIKPICPYYGACGGCDLMHMSYESTLQYKQKKVEEIITRYAEIDSFFIKPIIASQNAQCYRNKATFKVKKKVGFYGKSSYDLIPIDFCYLIKDCMNQILNILTQLNLEGIDEVVLRCNEKDEVMVIFYGNGENKQRWDVFPSFVTTVILYENGRKNVLRGNGYLEEQLGDFIFYISPTSFFQVNYQGMLSLYQKVKDYACFTGNEKVLDLYCGTGTIGIYLSSMASEVYGVEVNREAVLDAKRNAKRNHLDHVFFLEGDTKTIVQNMQNRFDIVVVDPPRSGLDMDVITYLLSSKIEKIIYVSCDPMTLARDLKNLKSCYHVAEMTPVDMFPFTYHVECVCVLNRR